MAGLSPQGGENARLRALATLREHTFHSEVPLIGPLVAWFRGLWNSVSTRWYVWPVIQQQSEFNRLIVDQLAAQAEILQQLEARFADQALALGAQETRINEHDSTLRDYDAWLVAQDHEQADTIRDLAEASARLIQMRRSLDDLDARFAHLTKRGTSTEVSA